MESDAGIEGPDMSHFRLQPRSQGFSPPRRGRAEKSPGNEVVQIVGQTIEKLILPAF